LIAHWQASGISLSSREQELTRRNAAVKTPRVFGFWKGIELAGPAYLLPAIEQKEHLLGSRSVIESPQRPTIPAHQDGCEHVRDPEDVAKPISGRREFFDERDAVEERE
jgi:hypothetical protein